METDNKVPDKCKMYVAEHEKQNETSANSLPTAWLVKFCQEQDLY